MAEAQVWHFDGTFKCVPIPFKQLLSIHGLIQGQMYPCVHILLPNKLANTYLEALGKVKHLMLNENKLVLQLKVKILVKYD